MQSVNNKWDRGLLKCHREAGMWSSQFRRARRKTKCVPDSVFSATARPTDNKVGRVVVINMMAGENTMPSLLCWSMSSNNSPETDSAPFVDFTEISKCSRRMSSRTADALGDDIGILLSQQEEDEEPTEGNGCHEVTVKNSTSIVANVATI